MAIYHQKLLPDLFRVAWRHFLVKETPVLVSLHQIEKQTNRVKWMTMMKVLSEKLEIINYDSQ